MKELSRAISVGKSGYKAMSLQVIYLMWLRTIMNYQYKNGGKIIDIAKKLYKEGGILRFYSGILPALFFGPICRFVDTFSNSIILNLSLSYKLPLFLKTGAASFTAGLIRVLIMPLDTIKTMKQVDGKNAFRNIKNKISKKGLISLYDGALTSFILAVVGHYPWFVIHNYLNKYVPLKADSLVFSLLRNAIIGFISSCFSDTISNSIHVLKVSKQTGDKSKSYIDIFREIKEKEGIAGFFFRGLSIRLFINGIQGLTFNILWKYFNSKQKIKEE